MGFHWEVLSEEEKQKVSFPNLQLVWGLVLILGDICF